MKRLILGVCAAALFACGSKSGGGSTTPVASVQGYSATRWIPENASYAITARTVRDAHRSARDLFQTIADVLGVPEGMLSVFLKQQLGFDAMSPEGLAQIGIDLDGGFAFYAEGENPTVAMHLASPQAFQKFIESQSKLKVQSIVVDGTDIFTAPIEDLRLSWAVVDGWLLVHFATKPEATPDWVAKSRRGGRGWWSAELEVLKAAGAPPIIGVGDNTKIEDDETNNKPIVRCLKQQMPGVGQGHFKVTMASDDQHMKMMFAADASAFAKSVEPVMLPVFEGWSASTAQVPIAAQWNVDLAMVMASFEPCARQVGLDLRAFHQLGIRGGRGYLRTFDPEDKKPTGALALDLTKKDFVAGVLDEIPMRSTFERNRTFGPYAGKTLAIPMYITVDYVLNDQLALAAVGEGLLVKLVGKGGMQKGPLFELALQPLGLSIESWSELLRLVNVQNPEAVAKALQKWREARLTARMEGNWLVFELNGTRR